MVEYKIVPGVGIGSVKLGASRDEARAMMRMELHCFRKIETNRYECDAYHENGFQIFYNGDKPHVEYIELSSGCGFIASYRGIDVFSIKANDLVDLIFQETSFDEDDPELGYSYVFPEIELSLWRSVLPQSLDDPSGQFFSTIGIGIKGYYSNKDFGTTNPKS
ncbi:hypothetical protein ANRL3_00092 [Anaerolineae bacterium]|nr:hypothetical protein ANRL3_00092 [Anaerolineae bacterium]